ncbi:glutamine amidotransferase-related protein [Ancylobacter lacus]|uniref:glutamine amidotransferase-related protein n=1 Tax=Ancylobacter lacus TaxID=2579970 RepID=UPI001BD1290D|nr:gamma-glutamyl-gamma-aminobutyrate hydrolase family protein [Ancylobacter lacus]MBS7537790.1 glutamine amidotransferase [Ancylobacter lacus]
MKRPRLVAIRHVAFEDLGILAGLLDGQGWDLAYCEAATDDLAHRSVTGADLVIVLGGPVRVADARAFPFLTREMALIETRLGRGRPTLGIGLGAQLMAAALGARLFPDPGKKIGWDRVALTGEGRASALAPLAEPDAEVLHWHGDAIELPRQAACLAHGAAGATEAFAVGRAGLGLRFHLEAGPRELEEWYVGHHAALVAAGIDIPALRRESQARRLRTGELAARVFGGWLARAFPRRAEPMSLATQDAAPPPG